jgi:hypothetical protein
LVSTPNSTTTTNLLKFFLTNSTNSKNSTNKEENNLVLNNSVMNDLSVEINFNSTNSSAISFVNIQSNCTLSSLIFMQFLVSSIFIVLHTAMFGFVFILTISKIKDV